MKEIVVQSNSIAGIGYDLSSKKMMVRFQTGDIYEYYEVSPEIVLQILIADSHGKAFSKLIRKGSYKYERVDADEANLHV